ncbi:MAG: hypothetical protein ABIO02_04440 [Patescibacteria group bacterium]
MSFFDLAEKIKGMNEELQGNIQSNTGRPVEGAVNKVKGKARQAMADIRQEND